MPWTCVTTNSRRFSRGSALMRATMSESPVVPMISWISGTFFKLAHRLLRVGRANEYVYWRRRDASSGSESRNTPVVFGPRQVGGRAVGGSPAGLSDSGRVLASAHTEHARDRGGENGGASVPAHAGHVSSAAGPGRD